MVNTRSKSRGSRPALRSLTSNEANKTNRKRKSRNGTNSKALQKQKKKNASSTVPILKVVESTESDPFDADVINEPPTKKRKLSPRSTLTPIPLADELPIGGNIKGINGINGIHHNNRNSNNLSLSANDLSRIMYPSGSMEGLRNGRRRVIDYQNDAFVQLKATNKELSKQNINHRQQHKKWSKKLKKVTHERDSLRQLVQALDRRDKKSKSLRLKHQHQISELEVRNEKLTAELNRYMKPDREDSVDIEMEDKSGERERDQRISNLKQQIKDIEYDASRWKMKYNTLLQQSNQSQETDSRIDQLKMELSRNQALYEREKKAFEDDQQELRHEHRELIEKRKSDHLKMKQLKIQTKTACKHLKAANEQRKKLKAELSKMQETTTHKMKELTDSHDAKMTEYKAMAQKLKASERLNQSHDQKLQELRTELAEMARDHAECVRSHVNRRDVDVLQNELNSIKTKYADHASLVKESSRKVSKLKKEMSSVRSTNDKLESSCTEYKQQIHDLKEEIKSMTESQGDTQSECDEMKKKIKVMTDDMHRIQERYNNAKQEIIDGETVRMTFELKRESLNREIRRYSKEMEGLQLRMQSLWRRYESERSKAKMWKMKLKTFTKQQKHRGANLNEWLLECRENEFKLNDFDNLDRKMNNQRIFDNINHNATAVEVETADSGEESDSRNVDENGGDGDLSDLSEVDLSNIEDTEGEDDDDDDDVITSPIPFPSPYVTKRGLDAVKEKPTRSGGVERNEKEEASESDCDEDVDLDADLMISCLSPIGSIRSRNSGSDVSTPSQFACSIDSATSSRLGSDLDGSEVESIGQ